MHFLYCHMTKISNDLNFSTPQFQRIHTTPVLQKQIKFRGYSNLRFQSTWKCMLVSLGGRLVTSRSFSSNEGEAAFRKVAPDKVTALARKARPSTESLYKENLSILD